MPGSKKKTIALTGATGFVGSHILEEALKNNYQIKALTRRDVRDREGVEWISGDLGNTKALEKLVQDSDALIHTAGLVKAKHKQDFFDINTGSVTKFIDIIGTPLPGFQFLYISSLAAREPQLSPYARSKQMAEQHVQGITYPWTIIRPPVVYGPGDKEILKLFSAMKRGFVPVAGEVENVFSLIHGRDLANAILSTLGHDTAFGAIIEPDDKRKGGYTILDVANIAEDMFGNNIKPMEIPSSLMHTAALVNEMIARLAQRAPIFSRHKVREMIHPNWVCDVKTHEKIAHWKPAYKLDEGIKETIAWYRANKLL